MQNETRDRLIELIQNADTYDSYECKLCAKKDSSCARCGAEKLADHLIANGAILLPCKVGDTVYVTYSVFYAEYKVMELKYDGSFVWAKLVNEEYEPQDQTVLRCIEFDLGKTIFLTEQEAREALKGGDEK